jgi:hypothetical protein
MAKLFEFSNYWKITGIQLTYNKQMDTLINIIEERLEQKQNFKVKDKLSFKQKLKKLPPELHPIAHELQKLVDSKATLDDGRLFTYSIQSSTLLGDKSEHSLFLDFYHHSLALSYGESTGTTPEYLLFEMDHFSLNGHAIIVTDSPDEVLEYLGDYIGVSLGSLGLLDRQIYSKKTQDSLGI